MASKIEISKNIFNKINFVMNYLVLGNLEKLMIDQNNLLQFHN